MLDSASTPTKRRLGADAHFGFLAVIVRSTRHASVTSRDASRKQGDGVRAPGGGNGV
jgi:hypothetical protein